MAKNVWPDYSFVRDGLTLEQWLWKLLDDSQANRIQAGESLQAMLCGLPSIHTDWSELAQFPDAESGVRFDTEVKQVLAKPDFNTELFVERLAAYRLALDQEDQDRVAKQIALDDQQHGNISKYSRITDQLFQTFNDTDDDAVRTQALNRLEKLISIINTNQGDPKNPRKIGAESTLPSGVMAYHIFNLLDHELLTAPTVLDAFLSVPSLRDDALAALIRIGPRAMQFAPRLIQLPDDPQTGGDAAHALGAVGQGDPFVVNEAITRLTDNERSVRFTAATVLQHMGTSVCQREEEICNHLLRLLHHEDERAGVIAPLASVGRHNPSIRATILALAKPREKKLRHYPNSPDFQYDLTMQERGAAISALSYFTSYPSECIPILVDAIKSFEEYDPDEGWSGALSRICWVLGQFGEDAAGAVIPLAEYLSGEFDDSPNCILEALTEIGASATPAIPALHDLRKRLYGDEVGELEQEIVDKIDDPIGWTIQRIQASRSDEGSGKA